jgi:glycosyltransferase involved in cell wall biosynthesis
VNQLAEFYSLANVFINPTWEDNFPTTNLEALACGTPVITYKTGGSVEAVDEETGFVVEQGDIDGLLTGIDCVKRKEKSEYIDICRSRAINKFNKNDRYLDYINLYDQLINDNKQ